MFWASEEKEPEERKAKQKISVTVKKSLRKEFDIINENWKEKGNHNGKH